jgi:hypothetical protein
MSVKPPLYGSGALEGTADSRSLTFTVTSDIGTLVFTGVHEGEQITGTYTVQHPTGGLETGSFKLSKESTSNPVLPTETMHRAHTPVGSTNISPPEKAPEVEESPKVVPPTFFPFRSKELFELHERGFLCLQQSSAYAGRSYECEGQRFSAELFKLHEWGFVRV